MARKLRFYLLVQFVLSSGPAFGQFIPDLNFRKAISDGCAACIDGSGNLTAAADTLKVLLVNGSNITSINGIEGFTSLTEFYCTNNQIIVIPPLPDSLRTFICSDNLISSLPALLPSKLQEFKCDNNQLLSIPPLPNKITQFFCSENKLTTLPTLPDFLDNFTCNDNLLTSLPPLPSLLTSLHCNGNQLSRIPELPQSLEKLYCSENELNSLPDLPSALTVLDLSINPIGCLPFLPSSIESIDFSFTYVTCLPNIPPLFEDSLPLPLCVYDSSACAITPKISGMAFIDYDGNGLKNGIDIPVSMMKISTNTGNWIGLTDSSGKYTMSTGFKGAYTILPDIPPGTYTVAPSSYSYTTNDSSDQKFSNADFALDPAGDNYDLSVKLTEGWAVASSPVIYSITYTNNSAFDIDGTIQFIFDSNLSFFSADVNPSNQNGYTLTWDFELLAPFDSKSINVVFNVSGNNNAGDTLKCSVTGTILGHIDLAPANNSLSIKNCVVNAAATNYMAVTEDIITPYEVAAGIYLTYRLYFQNTGTLTAKDVEVFDTLSNFLEASTFEMLACSHNYDLEISNADFRDDHPVVLHWTFRNIQLPSVNADALKSQGLIEFQLRAGNNTYQNAMIANKADIVFDYSSIPVVSNTCNTLVQYPIGISEVNDDAGLQIAPNPFSDVITVYTQKMYEEPIMISIYDVTGKEMLQRDINANSLSTFSINLSHLSPGSYLLKIKTGEGVTALKIFKQ